MELGSRKEVIGMTMMVIQFANGSSAAVYI
jgi:hypothetical protein